MVWEPFKIEEKEQEYYDEYREDAKPIILDTISKLNVVTEREIKVRLEDDFFPWVVSGALESLVKEGVIDKVGYPGRPSANITPNYFYKIPEYDYHNNLKFLGIKRDITT